MTTKEEAIGMAVEEAESELDLALPHVSRALEILVNVLGLDPTTIPHTDIARSDEWEATRLMQNVWSARLHIIDRFGS